MTKKLSIILNIAVLAGICQIYCGDTCLVKAQDQQPNLNENIQLLQDKMPSLRLKAAHNLAQFKDLKGVDALIEALKDEKSAVRAESVVSLQKIADPKAVKPLIDRLNDDKEDISVRISAAMALKVFKDKRAIPVLIKASKSEDALLRTNAVMALGEISDEASIDTLISASRDNNPNVRREAASYMGRMSERMNNDKKRQDAIARLDELSKNEKDPNIKRSASKSLRLLKVRDENIKEGRKGRKK